MEWDKALAELLLEEPEIRSWLGLDPATGDVSAPRQVDRPAVSAALALESAIAA